jgi:hypothetical protein
VNRAGFMGRNHFSKPILHFLRSLLFFIESLRLQANRSSKSLGDRPSANWGVVRTENFPDARNGWNGSTCLRFVDIV